MDYLIEPRYTYKNGKAFRSFEDTIGKAVKSSKENSVNIEEMFTGVNLLINSNLKDPINTSGKTIFSSKSVSAGDDTTTELASIDCWRFNKNRVTGMLSGDIVVEVVNNGIKVSYKSNLEIAGNALAFYQEITNPSRYTGESITASIGYTETTGGMVLLLIADDTIIASSDIEEGLYEAYCVGEVPEGCNKLYIAIGNKEGNTIPTTTTLTYAQVEVGKAPTIYKTKSREAESLMVDYIYGLLGSGSAADINAHTIDNLPISSFKGHGTNFNYTVYNGEGSKESVTSFKEECHYFIINMVDVPEDFLFGFLDVRYTNGVGFNMTGHKYIVQQEITCYLTGRKWINTYYEETDTWSGWNEYVMADSLTVIMNTLNEQKQLIENLQTRISELESK